MLVLKREKNQTIVVDGPCVITIGELGSRHVKVLLDGPSTTKILRGELVPHGEKCLYDDDPGPTRVRSVPGHLESAGTS